MKKNLITFEGKDYFLEKGILYEKGTGRRISEKNYAFARNYGTKPYDVLIISTTVFFIYPDTAVKIPCSEFLQEKQADIFYTKNTGDKNGNEIYVFIKKNDCVRLLGRSLKKITENVYKIGNYAYQIVDGKLEDMCPCTEFELSHNLLEIQTGEPNYSKLVSYKKGANRWKKIREQEQGRFHSRDIEIFL